MHVQGIGTVELYRLATPLYIFILSMNNLISKRSQIFGLTFLLWKQGQKTL
jgi:hypothetical protein